MKRDRFRAEVIRQLVEAIFPDAAVFVFQRAADALAHLRARPASLALIGLSLPDMDGLDLLTIITRERIVERMLVVSGRMDDRTRSCLRMASIRGYFDCNTETLATLDQAVRRVAEGGAFYSATLYSFDARDRRVPIQRVLNPSQLRVFAMIGDGSDDSTAATHLGLSPSTVNSHRKDIMARLGVHSRAELMKLAWATGMVRLAEYGDVLRPGFEAFPPERAARWTHPWPPAKGDHAVHSDADRGAA